MLSIDLDANDPRPIYRQIVDEIERSIAVGILRPGDPLPAAATVARESKVNINTVQHAYRVLANDGVVKAKRGLGTFVSPTIKENRNRQTTTARRIAERMLREAFRHGILASDLIAALREIAPGKEPPP